MQPMQRGKFLCAGIALALAALVPSVAAAHTDVFFGLNLGGLFEPPPVVYAPRVRYAPRPVYYVQPPVYYAQPPVYYAPRPVVYYGHRGWDQESDHQGDWQRGDRDSRQWNQDDQPGDQGNQDNQGN